MDDSQGGGDRQIIPAFLSGDPQAIRIVDGWIETVLHAEFRALKPEWEDLKQEIRLRVVTSLRYGRFNGDSTLRTYVHRIARYTGIDCSRKPYRRREETGDGGRARPAVPPSVDPTDRLIDHDLLGRMLGELSARDRALVTLVFGEHLSHAEVAERFGLTKGAIRSLLFRVRRRLVRRVRDLLGPGGGS